MIEGAKALSAKLGVPLEIVDSQGSSQTEISQDPGHSRPGQEGRADGQHGGELGRADDRQRRQGRRRLRGDLVEQARRTRAVGRRQQLRRLPEALRRGERRVHRQGAGRQPRRRGQRHRPGRRAGQHHQPDPGGRPEGGAEGLPERQAARDPLRQLGRADGGDGDAEHADQVPEPGQRVLGRRRRHDHRRHRRPCSRPDRRTARSSSPTASTRR